MRCESGELADLLTEQRNPNSVDIDLKSSAEIVEIFQQEDRKVLAAIEAESTSIATAIDLIAEVLRNNGRLFYIGAGTSGRLGVLDASECPPTFSTEPGQVQGLIAGGNRALKSSVEAAEDPPEAGRQVILAHLVSAADIVVGIAASGRTPYVLGGLQQAYDLGAKTVLLCCAPPPERFSQPSEMSFVDHWIAPPVGPEVVTGSTRLKAGPATKLVLNMLTTGAMIQTGRVYGNLMVDLQASNHKIKDRALRIVMEITGCQREQAEVALVEAEGQTKVAIVCLIRGIDPHTAAAQLESQNGFLRAVLEGFLP